MHILLFMWITCGPQKLSSRKFTIDRGYPARIRRQLGCWIGEVLSCTREYGNREAPYAAYAIAIKKEGSCIAVGIAGHVPQAISYVCAVFMWKQAWHHYLYNNWNKIFFGFVTRWPRINLSWPDFLHAGAYQLEIIKLCSVVLIIFNQ